MPIYVSFSSGGANSLNSGHSRVDSMSRGLTALTPAALRYALQSPRDTATGQAAGKRQYAPIKIVKEVDAASPSLYGYLANNPKLGRLKVHFVWLNPQGVKHPYFTLTLIDAALTGVQRKPHHPISRNMHELEEIEFAFQKIEVEWNGGGKASHDDWS